ncbi:unnamed protein product [Microthlaspi erraticum]|uniref:Reverse transcriptase domain-containing protein n=1 Tax=Microthlaspi erraticum TaxID=1685480 RepID=A0A6D2HT87_9BRAS|nr:unnamed protein product [Microthlaspi erraticum]
MLERLANHPFYCFLDGYSGFFQIPIHPNDQEKTTFTCAYGTFAYRRMPFGLCNAPATFRRCMTSIFSDLIEEMVEVFMDDFSVYGASFSSCLSNLCRVLQRCEETNLVLNWEKCHFMVREGIVLGHKISEKGIELDRAKVDVMLQLSVPKTVKDIRSFLGLLEHSGAYGTQGAWRDLAHGSSSTGYAKEEGRSHLEDSLDRPSFNSIELGSQSQTRKMLLPP